MSATWRPPLPGLQARRARDKALRKAEPIGSLGRLCARSPRHLKAEIANAARDPHLSGWELTAAITGCHATTLCRDPPSLSIPNSTPSPAFRYCGGFMPSPTPAGVSGADDIAGQQRHELA